MNRYLIALGSNVRHHRHGAPAHVLRAALVDLEQHGIAVESSAPILASPPLGHSRRRYANSAALVRCKLEPEALLQALKSVELQFGRRMGGKRWSARVLDLDIVLWDGGCWSSPGLMIPHTEFRQRAFVLHPASRIAPHWRDPLSGFSLRHLKARLTRRAALPKRETR